MQNVCRRSVILKQSIINKYFVLLQKTPLSIRIGSGIFLKM